MTIQRAGKSIMSTVDIEQERERLWESIGSLPDPEMPVVTLADLGILRSIQFDEGSVRVTITPTFSGCPAIHAIKADIHERLRSLGYKEIAVEVALSPAWTTDWISGTGRGKLKTFGISPPARHRGEFEIRLEDIVPCPYCGSDRTEVRNRFGPTPCRGIAFCNACQQPFEWIKPI
jgi:ring-1,2-phenylacetyl-CoA epoxidase subunit PaaD